ncbi:MAG: hypothetical protein A4E55_00300 [Pelotomaculum sp. PtaU1.Bin035]|nr:MAG: hypothetical protein A4E55_00300 [Pelotomaculum sp. PtaU1.Bin035]
MLEIKVQFDTLGNYSTSKKSMSRKAADIYRGLNSLKDSLDWDVKNCEGINRTLLNLSRETEKYTAVLNSMADFLAVASSEYKKCEDELSGEAKSGGSSGSGSGSGSSTNRGGNSSNTSKSGNNNTEPFNFEFGRRVLDILSKAGFVGGTFSGVLTPFANWLDKGKFTWSDKTGWRYWADVAALAGKGLIGASNWVVGIADIKRLKYNSTRIKGMEFKADWGLKNAVAGMAKKCTKQAGAKWWETYGASFKQYLKNETKDFVVKDKGTAIKCSKASLKWGGLALAGITNGLSNYDDYKKGNMSGWRAFGETVTETGLDFAKNLAIGAAVAGGLTLAVGSAPVLAVAAGTVAVGLVADSVTNIVFHKSSTELVSDLILDGGKAVGESIKDNFNKIVNCFKNPVSIKIPNWAFKL